MCTRIRKPSIETLSSFSCPLHPPSAPHTAIHPKLAVSLSVHLCSSALVESVSKLEIVEEIHAELGDKINGTPTPILLFDI